MSFLAAESTVDEGAPLDGLMPCTSELWAWDDTNSGRHEAYASGCVACGFERVILCVMCESRAGPSPHRTWLLGLHALVAAVPTITP